MLHKMNESYVISDDGYQVKLGRHRITYIENDDHAVSFEAEDIVSPYCLVIYFSGKQHYWHPPYNSENLTGDKLKTIKTRIIHVLEFLNIKYEID